MAQNHQIFVRIPAQGKDKPAKTIGVNHSWMHNGISGIKKLVRFLRGLEFDKKIQEATRYETASTYLERMYRNDAHDMYLSVINEAASLEDPRKMQAHNGITIIDLTGDEAKFCFMSINKIECEGSSDTDPVKGKIRHPNDPDMNQDLYYNNFEPITADHWMQLHYGVEWHKNYEAMVGKNDADDMKEMVKFLNSFKLLQVEEVAEIFPKMKSEELGRGLYLTPNSLRFIGIENKPIEIKATTKTTVKIQSTTPRKRGKKTDAVSLRAS